MKFFVIFTILTLNACSLNPNIQTLKKEDKKPTNIWVHKCPNFIFDNNLQNKSCS